MRCVPGWILRSLAPALVLSGAMFVMSGCSEEGPSVSGDPSKAGATAEDRAGKRPTEVEDGTLKKKRTSQGAERVKGVAPAGAQ